MRVRPTAVAGQFYPENSQELRQTISQLLMDNWKTPQISTQAPKVLVVPHAGYAYSGKVAATAYARLLPLKNKISRVVILAPSHQVPLQGIAIPTMPYETPLGIIPLDTQAIKQAQALPYVSVSDKHHAPEHALEVHLPFLQETLESFKLVPAIVGHTPPEGVATFLDTFWGDEQTLIIISTDLSHYLSYEKCQAFDQQTVSMIESFNFKDLNGDRACGYHPLAGLLLLASHQDMSLQTLDVRNSGDFSDSRARVVGYGSFALYENPQKAENQLKHLQFITQTHKELLINIARKALQAGLRKEGQLEIDFPNLPLDLQLSGAVFVTLTKNGALRGCIGSIHAHRPLALDVAYQAFAAGFHDNRFPALQEDEWDDLHISISILSKPTPFPIVDEQDALKKMTPGRDGFILSDQGHQGVFLPSVWEQLPDPTSFLNQLKRKAGLPETHWSPTLQLKHFVTHCVEDTATT